jgi:hypothetical protein
MGAFRLRRFSSPETLKTIAHDQLVAFLRPHEAFLKRRGFNLNRPEFSGKDFAGLAGIFVSPDGDTPDDLVNALYYVEEMSTTAAMDSLLAEIEKIGLSITTNQNLTAADVAVQIWNADRSVLERKHAEFSLVRPRTFASFKSRNGKGIAFKKPSSKVVRLLEASLNEWFEKHNRGAGARVFIFDKDHTVWFLIRHGEPYKREGSLDGAESSSVHFRPEKYDVLTYHPNVNELRVNAGSKGEKQLYRRQIGKHLFGSEDYFPGTNKYTLEPLREYGEMSLNCVDIEGIEWIKLKEYQTLYAGNPWELVSRKSDDVFELLENRGYSIPDGGQLLRATFQIKFTNCKTPRSVVIRSGNIAQFTRDDDSVLVEQWLESRGFIIREEAAEAPEENDTIVANA